VTATLRKRPPWWALLAVAAWFGYFTLLVYSAFNGPEDPGIESEFVGSRTYSSTEGTISLDDLIPFIALGVITFLIGLGMILNGLAFTIPKKGLVDRTGEAKAQKELEMRNGAYANPPAALGGQGQTTNDLMTARPSVTEHTTHQLKREP